MTTVALLGLDLILGLLAVAVWAYAAVRAGTSGLRWALVGLAVLLARLVTVLVLAGRGWELAAERVTVGVPLGLLAAAAAIALLLRARRGRPDRVDGRPDRAVVRGRGERGVPGPHRRGRLSRRPGRGRS